MKLNPSTSRTLMDPCKDSVQILNEQETLSMVKLKTHCLACGYLVCLELEPTAHKLLETMHHYSNKHLYIPFLTKF